MRLYAFTILLLPKNLSKSKKVIIFQMVLKSRKRDFIEQKNV